MLAKQEQFFKYYLLAMGCTVLGCLEKVDGKCHLGVKLVRQNY